MKYITAQVLGIAVTLICLISPQLKLRKNMLAMTILANTLSAINFLLMGSYSAMGVGAVAIIHSTILRLEADSEKKRSAVRTTIFSVLYIAGGFLPHILSGGIPNMSPLDLMPIAGALLFMCAIIQKKEQHMRCFNLANALVYLTYNAINLNTQAFAQMFAIASITTALFRYRKKNLSQKGKRHG